MAKLVNCQIQTSFSVGVSENELLCVSPHGLEAKQQLVQGVTTLLNQDSWDRLQQPSEPECRRNNVSTWMGE